MKTGFVILHYLTADDTINCVDSIKKHCPDCEIVIVDNASSNGSGKQLSEKYCEDSLVNVLLLEKNTGFACGNNSGIQFLRDKGDFDFICVLNNDTLILSEDFCQLIAEEYETSEFALLGPQIITLDGKNTSSPVEYVVDTVKKTKSLLLKRRIKLILNYLHLNFLLHNAGDFASQNEKFDHTKKYTDVKLHGSCWIFSKKFFEKQSGLNPSTFLYFEEDILFNELRKNGLTSVYQPEIKIKHLEDSSTKAIAVTSRKKNIFIYKNEIRSLKILRRILMNKE